MQGLELQLCSWKVKATGLCRAAFTSNRAFSVSMDQDPPPSKLLSFIKSNRAYCLAVIIAVLVCERVTVYSEQCLKCNMLLLSSIGDKY